jgi:Glycosyl hydrolase family 12
MPRITSAARTAGCALAAVALGTAGLAGAPAVARAATTMCWPYQVTAVHGGTYIVQDDEWGSTATECAATSGGAGFTVVRSALANAADNDPGAYPSIFAGCNWGDCTKGGLAAHPRRLSGIGRGSVVTTLLTGDPRGGAYDVAYDIWTNRTPRTRGTPDGTEVMVWLNHHGGVQPAGDRVARGSLLGGRRYDVWYSPDAGDGPSVTYEMTNVQTGVDGLDLSPLFADSERRRYLNRSWYLITVEAGFEIWHGGKGLAVKRFSVTLGPQAVTAPAPRQYGGRGRPRRGRARRRLGRR